MEKSIILDPGHGGPLDNGAHAAYPNEALPNVAIVNPGEVIEHGRAGTGYIQSVAEPEFVFEDDLNLQFYSNLRWEFWGREIKVNPTRTYDVQLKLSSRIRAVNEYFRQGSKLAISIHHDSFLEETGKPKPRGFCAYYHPNSTRGRVLAYHLAIAIARAGFPLHGAGFKPAGVNGIRKLAFTHRTTGTAVLCEIEFMSNPDGLASAMNIGHQQRKAQIMAGVIQKFLEE